MRGLRVVRDLVFGGVAGLLVMGGSAVWAQEVPAAGATQAAGAAQASAASGQASASAQAAAAPVQAAGGQQMRMGGMTGSAQERVRRADRQISTALTVTVEGRSRTFSAKELELMPQRTVTATNGHTQAPETYTGVLVSDLLAQMGLAGEAQAVRGRVLRSYLRATGADFYFVVYSGVELMGAMHTGEVIVATKRNGQGLGDAGALMLVSSEDKMPARWVRNLTSITLTPVS